jgi:hypothetical protein
MSENFEQRVKHILDDVQFEPHDEVWQNIRHTIKPEQKKRRFIFWWILPFVIAGGGLIYMLQNDGERKLVADNTIKTSPNEITGKPGASGQMSGTDKATVNEKHVHFKKDNIVIPIIAKKKVTLLNNSSAKQNINQAETIIEDKTIKQIETPGAMKSGLDRNSLMPSANTIAVEKATAIPATSSDSSKDKAIKDPVAVEYTGDSNIVTQKESGNKWKWGFTADIGISNKVQSLTENSTTVSRISFNSIPTSASGGSLGLPVYQKTTTTAKLLWGLGLVVQKGINRNISFHSSIGYQHQQFSSLTTTFKDSAGGMLLERNTRKYDLHFLNIYTGTSFRVVQFPDLKVSVGAGIDNQFLLASKYEQRKYLFSPAQFSSQKNNSTDSYKVWQPHLRFHLLADVYSGRHSWLQLSPYLRYGLRSFEKQAGNKNHLMSFGLTVNYFFK